ncbi:MAG: restriction endonuclease [Cytophagaceae bacterium]|jgi:hypothetical protein|nr:restriction endonuclease [Cytophagaceae bacterium]
MITVTKASGEKEPFSKEKLETSLRKAGANKKIIDEIVSDIESRFQNDVSTKSIYLRAFMLLRRKQRILAARYSLKKAIMQMGPTGHPFEYLVGQIFKHWGYDVEVASTIEGKCVSHEVDVIFTGKKEQGFVECKYYNSGGKFANVQVPLYIRSRVNDIIDKRKPMPQYKNFTFHGWVATNTRFTGDAESFGVCSGLNLISWDYPKGNSLKENIEKYNLFPITVLTELSVSAKRQLLARGIVLCHQLLNKPEVLLKIMDLNEKKRELVMQEIKFLCSEE